MVWRALVLPAARIAVWVFLAGFVLGAVRSLLLAPRVGETAAVALELPWMLAWCWWVCRRVVRRAAVPPDAHSRLVLGAWALLFLLILEWQLSVCAFGRGPLEFLRSLVTPAGALGIAGQLMLALMPWLQAVGGDPAGPWRGPGVPPAHHRPRVSS